MSRIETSPVIPDPTVQPAQSSDISRWALAGLALVIAALWMLIRPNRDISHDGMIYALYATARLHPESVGHDFFVQYGTQDHFTVFSPIYAAAIRAFGLDRAAALGIFITQAAFFSAAWGLARRLTTADRAILGVGLLVFLPSWYGSEQVFSHTEMFFTPRQPAEVLALLGIGFAIASRRVAAAACLFGSVLLHPIIAAAGIMLWIIWEFALPHPRKALIIFFVGIALCASVALLPHGPLPRFDHEWLSILQNRLPYLFPSRWQLSDWCWSVPGLATLIVGAVLAENLAVRKLSVAAIITAICGLILALVGSDLMHVIVAAQLQMWRWLWLPGVLSALLLPVIVRDAWQRGSLGKAAVLLLAACWLTPIYALILGAAALGSLCALGARRSFDAHDQKMVLIGACIILAIAGLFSAYSIVDLFRQLPTAAANSSHLVTRIVQLRILAGNTVLAVLVMLAVWQLGRSASPRKARLIGFLGLAACAVALPYSVSAWTRVQYPKTDADKFEAWRRIIPPDAEVLWPDAPPVTVWYSLHRASYWSHLQMAGIVFSRQDLDIGTRRENALAMLLPYLGGFQEGVIARDLNHLSPKATLDTLCGQPDLGFLVSWRDLGPSPYPTVTMTQPLTSKPSPLHLYRCNHERH